MNFIGIQTVENFAAITLEKDWILHKIMVISIMMNNTLNKINDASEIFSGSKNEKSDSLSWNALCSQGYFFNLNGSRSDDEWLADTLINDLAVLGIMTAGQLFRWIKMKDPHKSTDDIEAFIAALFRHQFIETAVHSIPVPQSRRIRRGENETEKVTIIFLTEKAKPHLAANSARFGRFGLPEGIDLARLYHDILIAESVLYLGREHLLCGIKGEAELKSEAGKMPEGESKAVPDFGVWLAKWNENGDASFFDAVYGEVVVQSDFEQNLAKPQGIKYFTANLRAADLIKSAVGCSAILLDDPALPAGSERTIKAAYDTVYAPDKALLRSRFKLFQRHDLLKEGNFYGIMLHLHNKGPLTSKALSALTRTRRENISRQLKRLITLGILHCEAIQTAPGQQLGSPEKLFIFADVPLTDFDFRRKQLKISQSIEEGLQV